MKRRTFIAGLSCAAAWPVMARAQRPAVPVIGFLSASVANSVAQPIFLDGLKEAGFVDHQNVLIEYRWAEGQYERLPELAADLVRRRVAVIFATGGSFVASAAARATDTIPIVFQGGGEDPVESGLVASLSRPRGNVTGITNLAGTALVPKQIEVLHELLPSLSSVGLLVNDSVPNIQPILTEMNNAARRLGWLTHVVSAANDTQLETGFGELAKQRIEALAVGPDPFFTSRRTQITALAARYGIPTSYYFRDFVLAGGLMSYGTDLRETNRLAAGYVARILKGEKAADLPVRQATRIEFTINMKTAKALGLTIPITLLGRADEVIE